MKTVSVSPYSRRITIRINAAFQALALACYCAQTGWCALLWRLAGRSPIPILLSLASIGITVRFLLARPREDGAELAVAYNWGFLLLVLQAAAFQLTYRSSPEGFIVYFVVLCQLALIYKTGPAAVFMLLFALMYCIAMLVNRDYASIILITLAATLGVSINFLIARLNREFLVSDSFFKQARWAASELSEVLLHLDHRLEDVRLRERQEVREGLAREIHDSVGCSLTALIVQLQVIEELMERGALRERVSSLRNLGAGTLREVRGEVTRLRRTEPAAAEIGTRDRIRQLCTVFSECTGVNIGLNIEARSEAILDTGVGEAVYRIVQEGFTNAYCHGCASMIDLSMKVKDGQLLVRISDNGNGCKTVVPGNGLKGIQERVAILGGTLELETLPGKGFDIGIDIPLLEAAHG
jgi:signal transduction histidine kinase